MTVKTLPGASGARTFPLGRWAYLLHRPTTRLLISPLQGAPPHRVRLLHSVFLLHGVYPAHAMSWPLQLMEDK